MLPKAVVLSFLLASVGAQQLNVVGTWPEMLDDQANKDWVPLRENINKLQTEAGPKWDLYIQSIQAMYDANEADPLSFFRTGAIHGRPVMEWGNTGGPVEGQDPKYYCPHGEILFLPWHRPYMVLFEQTMNAHAQRIAATYPEDVRATYQKAADSLRMPFWDWGSDSAVPQAMLPATHKIKISKDGKLQEADVPNPLSTYVFPQSVVDQKYGRFNARNGRIEYCPAPDRFPETANAALKKSEFGKQIYDVFTRAKDFDSFGTIATRGSISIEVVHNRLHKEGACGGQFFGADTTAMSMLFWLHHANMDRLWAYWQHMKPEEATIKNTFRENGRFAARAGTRGSKDSLLHPFRKEDGTMHTPDSVKSIEDFGYAYEGLEYWEKSPEQMKKEATAIINRLYGPPQNRRRSTRPKTSYYAKIHVEASELEKPCDIIVTMKGQGAGTMVVMEYPSEGELNGGFSIDDAMKSSMRMFSAQAGVDKEKLFQQGVDVSIITANGTSLNISSIPSLSVEIEEVHITPPTDVTELPKVHNGRIYKDIQVPDDENAEPVKPDEDFIEEVLAEETMEGENLDQPAVEQPTPEPKPLSSPVPEAQPSPVTKPLLDMAPEQPAPIAQ